MDAAYISAISALAGSIVGALTSGITTWIVYRAQSRAGRLAQNLSDRQVLFKEFIIEASKLYGNALASCEPKIEEFVGIYATINRIRLLCSPRIVACADKILLETIATFFAPNKSVRELDEIIKRGGSGIDPLREFTEAAREELHAFG
jgi:hypothetical protein